MNPRERQLVMIIGGTIGAVALYQLVDRLTVRPVREAAAKVQDLEGRYVSLQRERAALPELGKRWTQFLRRTYSQDERDTQNLLREDLIRLASKHKLRNVVWTPRAVSHIPKSDIRTLGFLAKAEGNLNDVVAFLRDFYRMPILARIRKMRLAPVHQVGGSDEIRIDELLVETLVLPEFEAVDPVSRVLKGATTLPADPAFVPSSLRVASVTDPDVRLLGERNVFKAYEPPPKFTVHIDNQDYAPVQISAKFFWKGDLTQQPGGSAPGKTKWDLPAGEGNEVEIVARYQDGKTFGPQRLTYKEGQPAVLVIPSHTPPPPPKAFAYRVRNEHNQTVDVLVSWVRDEQKKALPAMRVDSNRVVELPELEGQSLTIAATYPDGTPCTPMTYQVTSAATGTYVIPMKSAQKAPSKPAPKADPDLQVTGLLSYPGSQELIAFNFRNKQRKIISRGDEIDGGILVLVHPLGGVVRMPAGNFFLYPLGKKFVDRVELSATDDTQVLAAINEWNGQ